MIKSPAAILYDAAKNAIKSVQDSSDWLLGIAARIHDGTNFLRLKKEGDSWTTEHGIPGVARDKQNLVRKILSEPDGALIVAAKPPSAPPGTTEFVLAGDTPLEVGPVPNYQESVSAAIGSSVNLYLQSFSAGAAGDPSEKGSKVELYWREGGGPTDHLISRIYLVGQTVVQTLPNVNKARDGTQMTGDGSTTKLVIRRERLSTSAQEIDAEVRGYTE